MRWIYKVSLIGFMIAWAAGAAAQTAGPPADYKIDTRFTATSPDGATTIEQYAKDDPDNGYSWQIWVRRQGALSLLDAKPADYAAGFRFTNDSQWVVRMEKTGAGYADLYRVSFRSVGFRCRDQKTDQRSGLGLFLQPSGIAKNHQTQSAYLG